LISHLILSLRSNRQKFLSRCHFQRDKIPIMHYILNMSMIHVTKTPYRSFQIVDNSSKESGFAPESIVQSQEELRSLLIEKGIKEEEIERHLAQFEKAGEVSIVI